MHNTTVIENEIPMEVLIDSSMLCREVYQMPVDVYIKWDEDEGIKYIAIEGSDTLIDWYDNASFLFRKKDMHRGFYRYARFCMKEYNLLHELNDENASKIVITGHSLGAACVVIVLSELSGQLNGEIKRDVVLFGCPHVGGHHFMRRFQEAVLHNPDFNLRCTSLKNGDDIVCNSPPNFFGYRKSEALVYLDPMINQNKKNKRKNGIYDHMIDQYTKTLLAYAKNEEELPPKTIVNDEKKCTKKRNIIKNLLYAVVAYKTVKTII